MEEEFNLSEKIQTKILHSSGNLSVKDVREAVQRLKDWFDKEYIETDKKVANGDFHEIIDKIFGEELNK